MKFTYIGNQGNKEVRLAGSFANGAFVTANSAASFANGAFTKANNSLSLTGGTISGNVTANSFIANNSIYSPIFYSSGGTTNLTLSDIGIVAINSGGQEIKFGASGIESSKGIYGGSYGGNKLSLDNETRLISNRYDIVKIATGTDGTDYSTWSFSNNQLIFPDSTYQNTAFQGVAIDQTSRNTANSGASFANSAFDRANAAYNQANTSATDSYARTTANAAYEAANSALAGGGGAGGAMTLYVDRFTANGSTTTFNLSAVPLDENYTSVFVDGIFQLKDTYTLSSNVITFNYNFESGANIEVTSIVTGSSSFKNKTFTGDASTLTFTISANTTANSIIVTNNGLIQEPVTDYSVSGTTLTFVNAPASGAKIQVRELSPVVVGSSDDTTALAAFNAANSAASFANGAFLKANSSYTAQNTTASFANGSFDKANSAGSFANGAFVAANSGASFANAAFTRANSGYDVANSAASYANSAFITANTAYGWGNHASIGYATTTYVGTAISNLVNSAPTTLDTLNELAAALGNDANFSTTITTTLGITNSYANGAFDRANAAYNAANTNSTDSYARDTANASFLTANSSYNAQNTTATFANAAFVTANSGALFANAAFDRANAAYAAANTAGGGGTTDTYARDTANAAFIQANSAFAAANSASGGGVSTGKSIAMAIIFGI